MMIKQLSLISGLLLVLNAGAQTKGLPNYATAKHEGIYTYGENSAKGRTGSVMLYAESDSTMLFYIDLNHGAPNYHTGALYGRIKLIGDSAIFYAKFESGDTGCKWKLKFVKSKLMISTMEEQYDCGFGHLVAADGEFNRSSKKPLEFFETKEWAKIYFNKTRPEDYYKVPK